ncbi:MAG: NUMOD4 domain-containing protein, partial [Corynebacterium kroppenstedtii]|nr:NUMOD4 domain-containing protein [Corynebacterium kroppenstedtii]
MAHPPAQRPQTPPRHPQTRPLPLTPTHRKEETTMSKERWRPVVGYEGIYEVSDQGRVRSLDRIITQHDGMKRPMRGRILRQ